MRYCIFSDIHGNFVNLTAFFESTELFSIDRFICLGDVCNYYPENREVIDLLIKRKVECVLGNHDALYLNSKEFSDQKKIDYNFDHHLLNSPRHIDFLASLPKSIVLGPANVLFCHGSPNQLTYDYIYPDADFSKFKDCGYNFVFSGHTHRQFLKSAYNIIFCNVGSIGMPRDDGTLMGFAIFDDVSGKVELFRKKINKDILIAKYSKRVPYPVLDLLDRKEELDFTYTLIE